MTAGDADALARGIAREFRRRLQGEYEPRIRRCAGMLADADFWRRPAPNCNSVGNLMLHLAGNTTQWILGSFDATADRRDRPAEFAAEGGDREAVCASLRAVVDRACDVVDRLGPADLLTVRPVQVYQETGLAIVLHVLEHFSGHAGQIYAWTKQVTGADLRFYDL